MLGSIKYNLANLFNFSGRDARQTFWYYILFLIVLNFAISLTVSIPMMVNMFSTAFDAAGQGATPEEVQLAMTGDMGGYMRESLWAGAVGNVLMVLLASAAFIRRLHDSDHSGLWVILPIAGQLFSVVAAVEFADRMADYMAEALDPANAGRMTDIQAEMLPYTLAGWIGPVVVIVFGIMKSSDGPNRYGDDPVRF